MLSCSERVMALSQINIRSAAKAFADALDCCDFAGAMAMLAPRCQYDLRSASFTDETTLIGPQAIVDSYRRHDARARRAFDRVEYSSVVEHVEGNGAVIRSPTCWKREATVIHIAVASELRLTVRC
jgi:hypothetical protein